MPDVYTGTGQVQVNVAGDYQQAFLDFLSAEYHYAGFGKRENMDLRPNSGTQVTWERPNVLAAAITPIPEYVTPAGSQFSTSPITAVIAWYGDHLPHSERMAQVAVNRNILQKMKEVQVDQHRKTMDTLAREVLCGGTAVRYASGTSTATVDTVLDATDLDYALNRLARNDVPRITKKVTPSQLVGTVPLREAYIGICHVDMEQTLKGLTGWADVSTYAQPGSALPGEIGMYRGQIRFIATSNGKTVEDEANNAVPAGGQTIRTTATKTIVYSTIIFGRDYYGQTKLGGKDLEVIVKAPGSSGSADPFNQRGSVAWKQPAVFTRLDNIRAVRIESGCSSIA